ncbi:MAG: response regulator, partial [Spirochaetes bacterium]|nr:response regulator [Spirochaetota bacterium]
VNQSPVGSDPPAAPTAPFRVLVAEDNDLNRQLMGKLLDTIHVEHDTAENGRVALDKLRNARAAGRPFDILLLDIQMPVMDGMTCLAEVRADRELAGTHVIALTAHALTGDAEKFLDAGFDDYISKPMDIQNFFAKVRSLAGAQE